MAVIYSTQRPRQDLDIESESFSFDNQTFAGLDIFPIYEADERVADFEKIAIGIGGELTTAADQRREEGGEFETLSYRTLSDTFVCREFGLQSRIDRRLAGRNASAIARKERRAARNLKLNVMRAHEKEVIDLTVSNTTDFTLAKKNLLNAGTTFGAGTDILGEFSRGVHQFQDNTGLSPDICVIPRDDWRTISINTGVRGAFGDDITKPALLSAEMLQEILGVPKIVVPFVSYNAAARGRTASMQNLWPSGKILFAASTLADDLQPVQLGRTIVNMQTSGAGAYVDFSDDPRHSNVIAYYQDRDTKLMNEMAGLVLSTAAA